MAFNVHPLSSNSPQISTLPDVRPQILALQKKLLDEAALLIVESEIYIIKHIHRLLQAGKWTELQKNPALLGIWRDVRKAVSETVGIHSASTPSIIVQQLTQDNRQIISPGVLEAISGAFAGIPDKIRQPLLSEYERQHKGDVSEVDIIEVNP